MLQKYLDSKRISAHSLRTALTVTYLSHFDEWGVNLQMQWQTRPKWKVLDIKLHCEFEKQNNNMWLSLRVIAFQFMKYNFLRMTNFNEMICYCICKYLYLINVVHTHRAIFNLKFIYGSHSFLQPILDLILQNKLQRWKHLILKCLEGFSIELNSIWKLTNGLLLLLIS